MFVSAIAIASKCANTSLIASLWYLVVPTISAFIVCNYICLKFYFSHEIKSKKFGIWILLFNYAKQTERAKTLRWNWACEHVCESLMTGAACSAEIGWCDGGGAELQCASVHWVKLHTLLVAHLHIHRFSFHHVVWLVIEKVFLS